MSLGTITISLVVDEQYINSLNKAEGRIKEFASRAEDSLNKIFSNNFDKLSNRLDSIGQSFTKLGQEASKISLPILASFGLSANSAMQFEDELASVRKSTNATKEEIEAIKNSFLELSKTTRTSIIDLAKIATIGGQIGVNAQDVAAFTEAVNMLSVALGDEFLGGAEQVSQEVGILREIFQDIKTDKIDQDLLKIGNAINVLGADGLATGPVVADFANRIGGLTAALGNTAGDILGLSATLQQLGVTAERGGSAVGRIFQELASSPDKFAQMMGISAVKFKEMVDTNINDAFIQLLFSINSSAKTATEFAAVLEDLGLTGTGEAEVFFKLAQNVDLLKTKQQIANKALKDTSSVLEEYNIKNNTAQGNVEKLKNKLTALGITLSDVFLPRLLDLVNKTGVLVDNLIKAFNGLPQPVKDLIVNIGLFLGLLAPVLLLLGGLISSLGTLTGAIGGALSIIASIKLATLGWLAVIGLLVAGLILLAKRTGFLAKIGEKLQTVFNAIKNSWQNLVKAYKTPEIQNLIKKLQDSLAKLQNAFTPLFLVLSQLLDKVFLPFKNFINSNNQSILSFENAVKILSFSLQVLIGIIEGITAVLTPLINALSFIINIFIVWNNKITEINVQTKNFIIQSLALITDTKQKIIDIFNTLSSFFSAIFLGNIQNSFNFIIQLWQNLPQIAGIAAQQAGESFGNLINFLSQLPTKTLQFLIDLQNKILSTFAKIKEGIIANIFLLNSSIIQFFQNLPLNIQTGLIELYKKLNEIPIKIKEVLMQVKNEAFIRFTEISNESFRFGQNFVNRFIDGIKSMVSKIKETLDSILSNFYIGYKKTQNKAGGGIVQRFAKGGLVKKVVYASNGIFTPKGSDTVPAMLTPGELVLPKSLTSDLLDIIKQIGNLPKVSSLSNLPTRENSLSTVNSLNFNIGTINAGTTNDAKRRAGDLGWSVYHDLRARGLV